MTSRRSSEHSRRSSWEVWRRRGLSWSLPSWGRSLPLDGQWLVRVLPLAGLAIGGAMILLGLYLLVTQRTLGIMAASQVSVRDKDFDSTTMGKY